MSKANKGFSLVELIVVVLIMAIIAVALAPQVVKWIENARIANDLQTRDNLKDDCQLAMADGLAFNKVVNGDYIITVTKDTSGSISFSYDDSTGHDITPDPSDAYWSDLLAVSGCSDFTEFQNKIKIKSTASTESIVLKVKVYDTGRTIASLTGIEGNDDIEVVSDVIPET